MWLILLIACSALNNLKPEAPTVEWVTTDTATGDSALECVATAEICNTLDDDCDGLVDEEAADMAIWYQDADGDGWGDDRTATVSCPWPGAVVRGGDCNDSDALVVTRCEPVLLGDPEAILGGTPMERVFYSPNLLDGTYTIVTTTQMEWYQAGAVPGDTVVGRAQLALFHYPTSSESAGAPAVLGDGTAEALWVGDLTGDGMEDLLVETWAGVVVQDGAANWTPTIGPATVSLLPGPIAAGGPLPAARWSTELAQTVETAAVAARSGLALSGAGGEELFVADYTAIYTFDPLTGTATRRLSTSSAYPRFAAEDLNGDGIGDLAWSDYNKAKIALGPWTADPRSGSDEDVAWETEGFSVRAVGSGDFNQDGIAELVFVQRDGAYLLPASGGGLAEEAGAPHLVMRSGESLNHSSLAVGDANQDGVADLLLGDRNTRPSGDIWAFLGPILGTVDLDNADLRASGTGPSELGSGVAFGLSGDILTVASIPGEVRIWSLTE